MSDQTIDMGSIRHVAAAWSPEEPGSEHRVPPPSLGWDAIGTPADSPAPPVAMVSVAASQLITDARETWTSQVSTLQRRARTTIDRRHSDTWVLVECILALVAGLLTMRVLDAYGTGAWVALSGVVGVSIETRSQLNATSPLRLLSVVRSLALVFAATAMLTPLDLAASGDLGAAAWVLVVAGAVIMLALLVHRATRRPPRVVVVGDHAAISRAAMQWSDGAAQVIGGVLTGSQEALMQSIVGVPTIAGLDQTADWARGRKADLVVVAPSPDLGGQQVRHLAWSLERSGIRMAVADLVSDAAPHRLQAGRLGRTTVVELAPSRRGAVTRALKSVLDRLLGALLLVCALPFLLALTVLIRLDSPGGALFKQIRIGRDGEPFTMFKLRTMHVDAERQLVTLREYNEGAGVLFKIHDDPRVTRLGRVLRRTSLDELPQLINVVLGHMSLVGPRPALPREVAEYDDVERRRLAVKPGMTGLWQVSGRSNLDWKTSIDLDLDYVDNWRLSDDALIALRTAGAVTRARGAY